MTKHLDGKRSVMLCDLPNIKSIGGRPSSAPKLKVDIEYIPRASRALAAMALVRQAAANEIAVLSNDGCMDNRSYHDLLHPYGSGAAVVEIWKSR